MSEAATAEPVLAVVLVHYHAPRAVAAAVAALAADLEQAGVAAEWCVVDNGSTPPERAELVELGLPVLPAADNRGFAAGVNLGVEATTAGSVLVLNPDVEVLPGCVRALLDEIDRGAAAAAPRLYWDRERRFLLPPGEERTRGWELLSLLASRSRRCAVSARRRWRRDARRHWEAASSISSMRLSGAAIALSRAAWARVGPFDEGFRLYFEETDWLLRLTAAGLEARQAAGAEAVHAFAHSTKDEPAAARWFDQSARRFRERHYGRWFVWLLDRLAPAANGATPTPPPRWREDSLAGALDVAPGDSVWLELSPNRDGFPAAGERVRAGDLADWRPPVALMRASGIDAMSLCVATADGRELGRWWIVLDAPAPTVPR
jgi:GT2 family glycosyltransferase